MAEVQLQSTLTCPHCGHKANEIMPTDACVAFYDCNGCGKTLKPLPGSCCVFCSYGSVPCPPIQEGLEPCCTPKPDQRSKDWVGSRRTSVLACWLPSAAIVVGLFVPVPTRTVSRLDGHSLHLECPAVWPHSLSGGPLSTRGAKITRMATAGLLAIGDNDD